MSNFNDKLQTLLKTDSRFVDQEGELIRNEIINQAFKIDAKLIELLISDDEIKSKFFNEIKGHRVFNINKFVDFIQDKNFLDDSYTKYKNKIGLNIGGKFLRERDEVSLVRPYKDCILEGGQSKEDQKRKEIFFNEILAQDEIDRLLDPKVLTNFKKYTKDGEKQVESFTRDENGTIKNNLIIKGNNLLALHSLKKEFAGKVKLIYIDPPYYFSKTSKNVDSFTYNSNFKLSTWLVFLRNRITEAKQLLSENGIIFISIDDGGQAHLKLLLDEIFGCDNFIANLPTIMNLKGNNDEFAFAGTHEYTIVYAKNKAKSIFYEFPINEEEIFTDWEEDDIGYFKRGANLKATGTNAPKEKRPNLYYPIFIDANKNIYVTDNNKKKNENDIELLPITNGVQMSWRWQKKKVKEEPYNIIVVGENNDYSIYKKQRPELGDLPSKKPKTIFYKPEYSSGNGTAQIKELFGEKVFSNPKPLELIKDIVLIGSAKNDIVLDFHAGSGTTAHAVLELNKEDGGNRQFILCEQMDYVETVTSKRIQKVIKQNKSGEFIYCELKKYNQDFIDQIQDAKNTEELLEIWENMKAKSFLNYNVDIAKQDEAIEEFKQLSLDQQKEILVELLDKNQLYVNLSEMNDKDFEVNEEDKRLNDLFYNG